MKRRKRKLAFSPSGFDILLVSRVPGATSSVVVKCDHKSHGADGLTTTTISEIHAKHIDLCPTHGMKDLWGYVERKEEGHGTQDRT